MMGAPARCLAQALLALSLAGGAAAAELRYPGSGVAAEGELPSLPELAVDTVDLGILREQAFAVAETYPVEDYFVGPLAAALAGDPLAAFAYVRDDIALDPYEGSLRGPLGVLGARAGSSADKAVLLVELLRAMGIEARFAFGTLDASAVERLRAAALQPLVAADDDLALARLVGLSPAALERLAARARRDFAWLWAAAGERLTPTPLDDLSPRHVWVQALIDGTWTDLDVSLPDLAPGDTVAAFEESADALPEDLVHAVEIELVAESFDGDALSSATLLQRRFSAPEGSQTHVFLTFAPADTEGAAGIGSSITEALGAKTAFQPLLLFGEEVEVGAVPTRLPAGESGGAQAFFFGEEEEEGPELTALYLDVTLHAPGAAPATRRRVLLDRVAPAARETGSATADDLAAVVREDEVPLVYRAIHQIIVSTGGANPHQTALGLAMAVDFLGTHMATEEAFAEMSLPEQLWPVGAFNDALLLASERLAMVALNDRADLRFFAGRPRITIVSLHPAEIDGEPGLSFAFDFLHDSVEAVAAAEVAPAAVAERRLWYGVLQSALETTVAELRVLALAPEGREVLSTSTEMSADLAVLDGGAVEGKGAPAAVRDAIAEGELVIANAGARPAKLSTWWTVDPTDGSARAVLAPGLGGIEGGGRIPPGSSYARPGAAVVESHYVDDQGYRLVKKSAGRSCRAGPEYLTILGCVSLPGAMGVGMAYALIVGEIVILAGIVIAATI